jgi:hypothetical protein
MAQHAAGIAPQPGINHISTTKAWIIDWAEGLCGHARRQDISVGAPCNRRIIESLGHKIRFLRPPSDQRIVTQPILHQPSNLDPKAFVVISRVTTTKSGLNKAHY